VRAALIFGNCAALVAILLPAWAVGQESQPLVELDHVTVLVQDYRDAVKRLSEAGVKVEADFISRHEGEGTASVSAIFGNAYLEIKWVETSVQVDDANRERVKEIARAATWMDGGASPFAVALRRLGGAPESLPYAGTAIQRFAKTDTSFFFFERSSVNEPSVFVVPSYMALPAWIEELRIENPGVLRHALGLSRLTNVIIETATLPSEAAQLSLRGLSYKKSESPTMELVFDGGRQGGSVDFRPGLPLFLKY
jgi:hypothetical protein